MQVLYQMEVVEYNSNKLTSIAINVTSVIKPVQ